MSPVRAYSPALIVAVANCDVKEQRSRGIRAVRGVPRDGFLATAAAVRTGTPRRREVSLESPLKNVSEQIEPEGTHVSATPFVPDFPHGDGLLPAIAQDVQTGEVLMLAYMNAASFAETLATGRAVYWSRSRGRLWRKGEESGHVQQVRQILVDCDADTILLKVEQTGAACHEGFRSCFFRQVTPAGLEVVAERLADPQQIYTREHP